MHAEPFRRPPMVDFEHPAGESLFWRISDAMERLVEQLEQHSPAELFFQKVNRDIAQAEAEEATMPHADQKAREDYIHRLSEAVDRAFNERDRLWAANGYDCPKAARQEEIAVALLDQFNAEVEVDVAEVERRRAENLACYRAERENQWIHEKDAAGSWTKTPPPAEPYRPPTTSNEGSAMPNIEEARAGVMGAKSTGESALAELAQAHSALEDTQNALRHATEGSNQPEADQAHGLLAEAMSKIDEARQQVASALAEFEGVGARL